MQARILRLHAPVRQPKRGELDMLIETQAAMAVELRALRRALERLQQTAPPLTWWEEETHE